MSTHPPLHHTAQSDQEAEQVLKEPGSTCMKPFPYQPNLTPQYMCACVHMCIFLLLLVGEWMWQDRKSPPTGCCTSQHNVTKGRSKFIQQDGGTTLQA